MKPRSLGLWVSMFLWVLYIAAVVLSYLDAGFVRV